MSLRDLRIHLKYHDVEKILKVIEQDCAFFKTLNLIEYKLIASDSNTSIINSSKDLFNYCKKGITIDADEINENSFIYLNYFDKKLPNYGIKNYYKIGCFENIFKEGDSTSKFKKLFDLLLCCENKEYPIDAKVYCDQIMDMIRKNILVKYVVLLNFCKF